MRRVDVCGLVHFAGGDGHALCGLETSMRDLVGAYVPLFRETTERVTCPACARIYARVKYAPWNELDGETLHRAVYDAAKEEP